MASRCRLLISVGQPYHEGDKLAATVDWLNRHVGDPFVACEVLVADTLQRHNDGAPTAEAHARASRAGADWLARNRILLDAINCPCTVIRWDDLLLGDRFAAMRARVQALYDEDPALANAIELDVTTILERRRMRGEEVGHVGAATRASREYLLEELAVLAIAQADASAATLYPGTWPKMWNAARASRAADVPPGLRTLIPAHLRIERRRGAHAASAR